MTNTIQNLYNEYRASKEYPVGYALDFFSKNSAFFDSIINFQEPSDLKLYIELAYQYLSAIHNESRFNDTADMASKYLKIVDSEINRFKINSLKDEWYYGLLSYKAISTYKLRDYKTCVPIFKQLVAYDPKNENYKLWLNYSKYGQRMWISKVIIISCFLLISCNIMFGDKIPSRLVRMSLDGIGILGVVFTFTMEYHISRSIRKTKMK